MEPGKIETTAGAPADPVAAGYVEADLELAALKCQKVSLACTCDGALARALIDAARQRHCTLGELLGAILEEWRRSHGE